MKPEDAIRKMIKMYWEQQDEYSEMSSLKGKKYTKKYFDSVRETKETKDKGSK